MTSVVQGEIGNSYDIGGSQASHDDGDNNEVIIDGS